MEYKVVSGDDHISESPTTFTDRVPASMKDKVPYTKQDEEGISYYWVGGEKVRWANHVVKDEKERDVRLSKGGLLITYAFEAPGQWDLKQRMRDYDIDGIDAAILFPNQSLSGLREVEDLDVRLACFRGLQRLGHRRGLGVRARAPLRAGVGAAMGRQAGGPGSRSGSRDGTPRGALEWDE